MARASSTRRDFWNSKQAQKLVQRVMGQFEDWHAADNVEPWEALRDDVIGHNSRGRFLNYRPGRRLLEDLPQRDDGTRNYPRFRVGLVAFADLLIGFRKHLQRRFGRNCWDGPEAAFKDDGYRRTFFELLRDLSAAERTQAADALKRISREGLRFQRPGGIEARYKDRDCGIGPLVDTARRVEALLAGQASKTAAAGGEEGEIEPGRCKRVLVTELPGLNYVLRYEGKEYALSGDSAKLFALLFTAKGDDPIVSYDDINEAIWSRDPNYQPVRGRSSERLRTLKNTMEQQLRNRFGKPPTGRWWILMVKRQGLKLNRKAVTWELHEPIKKTRERPFSQFHRLDDLG